MLITVILLLPSLLALALYLFVWKKYRYWKLKGIPYVEPSMIFGNLSDVFKFKKAIGVALRDFHLETSTPYTGLFFLTKPVLLIKDLNLIKTVLIKRFDIFYDRNNGADERADLLSSQILFMIDNPKWSIIRRKMSPVYTSGKMKSMYGLIAETGNELVTFLSKIVEENNIVNCKEVFLRYGTDVITSTAFGIKANCFEDGISEFRSTTMRLFNFNLLTRAFSTTCYFVAPLLVRLLHLKLVDAESASFLRSAFWKTIKARENSNIIRHDLIHLVLEIRNNEKLQGNNDLDGDTLLAQAVQFFLGGYETTSSAVTFALQEIARNPEVQNNLREEIEEALKEYGSFEYDVLNNLKYLDMVFKETLRKYPILPFLDRKCSENYVIPGTSHVIEKGEGVCISTLGLHMDPDNFPNPEEFIPERFSPENAKEIKPYTYLPFGDGPRNCIGARFGTLSVKSALANVIANFEIEICEDHLDSDFHPKAFLLTPRTGELPLKFRKISRHGF